jgi:NAD(P)-dependent dehydrogenase (short-subunit alcohol dehydrogenase family)
VSAAEHDIAGKVAVVTGGGRGLGRAMAGALARHGASVAVAARSEAELDSVVTEVEAAGGKALAVPTDVTDERQVEDLVARTVERFGRIDVLVNNSGIVATTPLVEQSADEWDRVVATNLRGTFLACRAAGRRMLEQRSGKVVNIASHFGLYGVPDHVAYSASKAGVIGLTRSLAIEWARANVQVNAIAPGYFATPLNEGLRADADVTAQVLRGIPARRMGEPDEITPWLLLLAGSASDFMTGEVVVLDGGQSVR